MSRFNTVTLMLGKRGSGKSFYTYEKLLPAYQKAHPDKKILIVDTLDHPNYQHIPVMPLDQLGNWSQPSIYRIFGSENRMEIVETISKKVSNCFVIFEDATKIFGPNPPEWIIDYIIDTKQKDVDILFMFHSFQDVPPKFGRYTDAYCIFVVPDISSRKNQIREYDTVYKICQDNAKNFDRDNGKYPVQTILLY